jgi:hypothetical protein
VQRADKAEVLKETIEGLTGPKWYAKLPLDYGLEWAKEFSLFLVDALMHRVKLTSPKSRLKPTGSATEDVG